MKRRCEEGRNLGQEVHVMSANCKDILNYITKPIGNVSSMDVSHFIYEHVPDRDTFDSMFTKSDRLSEIKKALHIPSHINF